MQRAGVHAKPSRYKQMTGQVNKHEQAGGGDHQHEQAGTSTTEQGPGGGA